MLLDRIVGVYKLGGTKLIWLKVQDKLNKTDKGRAYLYRMMKDANPSNYPHILELLYRQKTGSKLHLENPQTFNEKIQWLKLYDSTPQKTRLADKYLVREWIKEKIGEEYLVPLLGVWDRFDDIDFSKLPDKFVLKCNHGSGWNYIVQDKERFDKTDAKQKFDKWMSMNYAFCAGLELHYKDISPKIIAEQYLEVAGGLKDYRFYCFNGMPLQCWVDLYSGTPAHIRSVFDMKWNKLDLKCTWPDGDGLLNEQPKNFEHMKELAAILSEGFTFVRVDFFEVSGRLYMGEMTFTPMGGYGKFIPYIWDQRLGSLLRLPCDL